MKTSSVRKYRKKMSQFRGKLRQKVKGGPYYYRLKKGIPAAVISGERLPVQINGKCRCYLPWEDRTEETAVKDFFCTLPDFRRSIVVRVTGD